MTTHLYCYNVRFICARARARTRDRQANSARKRFFIYFSLSSIRNEKRKTDNTRHCFLLYLRSSRETGLPYNRTRLRKFVRLSINCTLPLAWCRVLSSRCPRWRTRTSPRHHQLWKLWKTSEGEDRFLSGRVLRIPSGMHRIRSNSTVDLPLGRPHSINMHIFCFW